MVRGSLTGWYSARRQSGKGGENFPGEQKNCREMGRKTGETDVWENEWSERKNP